MIGTIIPKPIENQEQFRAAMRWCCDPANNARMMEYADRYEVAVRPEEPEVELAPNIPEVTIEERLDDIENALIELAGIIAEGE